MTRYEEEAWRALQVLFDDERRSALADRVNEILDLLDAGGTDRRARAGAPNHRRTGWCPCTGQVRTG